MKTKSTFKMKQKVIFINFKDLSLKQTKQILLESEESTLRLYQKMKLYYELVDWFLNI